uniref:PSI subunit V n=1 Tax=Astrosyne radiata TaxID=1158023 RepID=A0A2U9NT56_9STRA|nr:photosystem I protein subunit XI [Astrosyne radiata]AWT40323.1 photosystem I protein subunit XI [Astrosyne radiata]|mmetsp:Transcript_2032/g.4820  ORF Transcript_2032/g.4820 Transcript_2032/m.4820 type:complete len:112 (-) Transcript_2032:8-343(-)
MLRIPKKYKYSDPFTGDLQTVLTTSWLTKTILKNLPIYRPNLTPFARGLEIGLAHGYFLIGPFVKLGPLRNLEIGLFSGFLSTIGLNLIMISFLTYYGLSTFSKFRTKKFK